MRRTSLLAFETRRRGRYGSVTDFQVRGSLCWMGTEWERHWAASAMAGLGGMDNSHRVLPPPPCLESGVVSVQPLAHAYPKQTYDVPSAAEDEHEVTRVSGVNGPELQPSAVPHVAVQFPFLLLPLKM